MTPLRWPTLLEPEQQPLLAKALLEYVLPRRWFRAKGRTIRGAGIADLVPLDPDNILAILRIDYASGDPDLYAVPLAMLDGPPVPALGDRGADGIPAIVAPLGKDGLEGAIIDGLQVPGHAAEALLDRMRSGRPARGEMNGQVRSEALPPMVDLGGVELPTARLPRVEQTNSTAVFGDRVLLKIYRQLTSGANPELWL